MPRPIGSTNKPKTQEQAQIAQKNANKKKVVKKLEEIKNRFESQLLGTDININLDESKKVKTFTTLNEMLSLIKEKVDQELTPEEKIKSLEDEIESLNKAIKKFIIVIDYLETKLGIDE